jgi:simple sugar transport system ATP-binding protein
MDEPTSVLTPQAVRKLFDTLRQLAAEGCSILYISHKLDEIQELCHVATVLRGGKVTGDCIPSEETPKSMASLMIGRELPVCEHEVPSEIGEVRLCLNDLTIESEDPFGTSLQNINLEINSGEVFGIAGVSGNGQQELLYALSGEEPIKQNEAIVICGEAAGRKTPDARRVLGMGFVPEERLYGFCTRRAPRARCGTAHDPRGKLFAHRARQRDVEKRYDPVRENDRICQALYRKI